MGKAWIGLLRRVDADRLSTHSTSYERPGRGGSVSVEDKWWLGDTTTDRKAAPVLKDCERKCVCVEDYGVPV